LDVSISQVLLHCSIIVFFLQFTETQS
jgi:hypothetical protein